MADHQQLLHATFKQRPGIAQNIADRARNQITPHRWDDTEGTAVVAALAYFQIGIVPRRQLDTGNPKGVWNQVDKRIVRFGQVDMDRIHHFLRRMWTGHGEHLRMHLTHQVTTIGA